MWIAPQERGGPPCARLLVWAPVKFRVPVRNRVQMACRGVARHRHVARWSAHGQANWPLRQQGATAGLSAQEVLYRDRAVRVVRRADARGRGSLGSSSFEPPPTGTCLTGRLVRVSAWV